MQRDSGSIRKGAIEKHKVEDSLGRVEVKDVMNTV